eukprot:1264850-Amphidinium_carterae.1
MVGWQASLSRAERACGCTALQAWAMGRQVLTPQQVAGLIDGEGCLYIRKSKGREVFNPMFSMSLNIKDWPLLEAVRECLDGHGTISVNRRFHLGTLQVASKLGVQGVANLLDKHPLLTTKYHDAQRWSRCVQLFTSGDHLRRAGIAEMSLHKAAMNSNR